MARPVQAFLSKEKTEGRATATSGKEPALKQQAEHSVAMWPATMVRIAALIVIRTLTAAIRDNVRAASRACDIPFHSVIILDSMLTSLLIGSPSSGSSSGSGSSGSTGSSGGSTSSGNRGGRTGGTAGTAARPGSGVGPGYGGGRYYGGGAAVPYRSGGRSRGGIRPLAIGAGAGLAFGLAGLWLYSVYAYNYPDRWNYRNSTTNEDESKPVVCLCEEYSECGCDPNTDPEYQKQLLGDGSYDNLNKSLITVGDINGTSTIILNGTLPNGTIEAAEAGDDGDSGAFGINQAMMKGAGYWALTALVGGAVFFV